MLARLALLFVIIPLVELVLLVQLGQWVGLVPTVALVVGTGILGAALARAEGLRTWLAFQREVAEGRLPGRPLLDGLAVLIGGAFLLTPGLLTDLVGFSLLFPPTRGLIRDWVRRRVESAIESGQVRMQVWTPFGWSGSGPAGPGGGPESTGLDPRHEIRPGPRPGSSPDDRDPSP